ncbi:MAG: DUF433 domain-containing protein [Planctomycetes bacterium]|nr:DUF433 domain-containing protein [Planctomycetota bacterium]
MEPKSLDQHIEITPGVCGGRPRIAGHRITVRQIVVWHDRLGRGADDIATEYDLQLSDVYAALAYYFDHRKEIDQDLEDSAIWIAELKQRSTSLIKQSLGVCSRRTANKR